MATTKDTTPYNLYLVGRRWYVETHSNGVRTRLSTGQTSKEDAILWVESRGDLLNKFTKPRKAKGTPPSADYSSTFRFTEKWISDVVSRCRYRGGTLTEKHIRRMIKRAGGKCELTGVKFSDAAPEGSKRAPFSPSIDRVNPHEPYSVGNCRLVCLAANVAINQWGESVLVKIAMTMAITKLTGGGKF